VPAIDPTGWQDVSKQWLASDRLARSTDNGSSAHEYEIARFAHDRRLLTENER
jgi:hypothetical protein